MSVRHSTASDRTIESVVRNFQNPKEFASAGDFEGYVSYGWGLQTAPGSDQLLKIRTGELTKPDGSDDFSYVIHFDIETV